MDGLFFDFVKKREKARVYLQYIQSIFTLDPDFANFGFRYIHIWGVGDAEF